MHRHIGMCHSIRPVIETAELSLAISDNTISGIERILRGGGINKLTLLHFLLEVLQTHFN